jgi:hypothetical protein
MELAIDKFHPDRLGKITGSKCSVLFPKRSASVGIDTYARQLASELYFKFYDERSTWQTEHGNYNENEAFHYYQERFSKTIEFGSFKSKGDCAGTSDAIDIDMGIDFKCPTSLEMWLNYLYEGISNQQYNQGQMYCYIFDKPVWRFCAYLTETQKMTDFGLTYPVHQDKRMIFIDVKADSNWVNKLNIEAPKLIQLRDHYYNILTQSNLIK